MTPLSVENHTFVFPPRERTGPPVIPVQGLTRVEKGYPAHDRWRASVGKFIAQNLGYDVDQPWTIKDFPEGYSLWLKPRTGNIGKDYYLYGFGGKKRFSSAMEFAYHAIWLYDDDYHDNYPCSCTLHTGRSPTEVADAWRGLPGRPMSDAPPAKPRKPNPKSATTLMLAEHHIFSWLRSERLHRDNQPSPRLFSSVSHQRNNDLTSLRPFRVGELVWVSIPPLLPTGRNPTSPEEVIKFWPAIVKECHIKPVVQPHTPGSPYITEHHWKYAVHLLAVSATHTVDENNILSWQTMRIPRIIREATQRVFPPFEVTEGLEELKMFQPIATPPIATPLEDPLPPIPRTFENALGPLSLALRITRTIGEQYFLSDRYSDDDPDLGVREMYQGLWWGPERIWVDDLVRLVLSRNTLAEKKMDYLLLPPSSGAQDRCLCGRISAIVYDKTKMEPRFFATLFELIETEQRSKEEIPARPQHRTLSVPAHSALHCYKLPDPPHGFQFRQITPAETELYLPIQYIAGRYDPLPVNSPAHRELCSPFVASRQAGEGDERNAGFRRMLSLTGLVPGELNYIQPIHWVAGREYGLKHADEEARRVAFEKWKKMKEKAVARARLPDYADITAIPD